MRRGALLALLGIAAFAAAAMAVKLAVEARRPKGADVQQLQRMLLEAEKAAERRDAAGVSRFVSDDYQDSLGFNSPRLKYEIRQYLRRQQALDLDIPSRSVRVRLSPDRRTGIVQFHLALAGQNAAGSAAAEMDLTLKVARERVYYYWFFPGEEWRVTEAEGYSPLE